MRHAAGTADVVGELIAVTRSFALEMGYRSQTLQARRRNASLRFTKSLQFMPTAARLDHLPRMLLRLTIESLDAASA